MTSYKGPQAAYFGHPKSASSWLAGYMMRTTKVQGKKFWQGQLTLTRFRVEDILAQKPEVIITQNSELKKCQQLKFEKAFHVIRDPRDIIVSSYFSYAGTHDTEGWSELLELRRELEDKPIEYCIERMIYFNERDVNFMKNWDYNQANVLELKYEDMIQNMTKYLTKVMEYLGWLKNDESPLQGPIHFYNRVGYTKNFLWLPKIRNHAVSESFVQNLNDEINIEKLKRKKPSSKNHYRKGKSGDWKNYFNDRHRSIFRELYGDILIDLGYEEGHSW
ncbi:MAG: sulfotransferase domain-containing protein [Flavobacteriales bacterium]|nr:sulfotransferase domain-containing protein [Flavobacteriales bacterium]